MTFYSMLLRTMWSRALGFNSPWGYFTLSLYASSSSCLIQLFFSHLLDQGFQANEIICNWQKVVILWESIRPQEASLQNQQCALILGYWPGSTHETLYLELQLKLICVKTLIFALDQILASMFPEDQSV